MSTSTPTEPTHAGPAFASIVCGVDGSRPSLEAARQAAVLAGGGALLRYVAVTWEQGVGATAVATLSHRRAQECLRQVRDEARELGVEPETIEEASDHPADRLMEAASQQDLLVVGIRGHSRAGGIMVGSAASAALHRSPVPVLVARRPPDDVAFPSRILLASGGTPESHAAAEVVIRLAQRHVAAVGIVAAHADGAERHDIASDAAAIRLATGTEAVILDEPGPPHRAVVAAAEAFRASLVVTGSRGLTGIAALRSASERIAHAAPCSVLVLRPAAG